MLAFHFLCFFTKFIGECSHSFNEELFSRKIIDVFSLDPLETSLLGIHPQSSLAQMWHVVKVTPIGWKQPEGPLAGGVHAGQCWAAVKRLRNILVLQQSSEFLEKQVKNRVQNGNAVCSPSCEEGDKEHTHTRAHKHVHTHVHNLQ